MLCTKQSSIDECYIPVQIFRSRVIIEVRNDYTSKFITPGFHGRSFNQVDRLMRALTGVYGLINIVLEGAIISHHPR